MTETQTIKFLERFARGDPIQGVKNDDPNADNDKAVWVDVKETAELAKFRWIRFSIYENTR